jgi:hypothetical protein
MKDILSKATFGFFMAQLFPGSLIIFSIAFVYLSSITASSAGILSMANQVLALWANASITQQLLLLALCIGAGMFAHGLHWAVLGYLEKKNETFFKSSCWDCALWLQVIVAPAKLIIETAELFLCAHYIKDITMTENAPNIHKNHMKQFEFIEDFYLYPAQFFCHTAYSLLAVMVAIAFFAARYGFTFRRCFLYLLVYLLCGIFATLGRIQLGSLFGAEEDLVQRSGWTSIGLSEPASEED